LQNNRGSKVDSARKIGKKRIREEAFTERKGKKLPNRPGGMGAKGARERIFGNKLPRKTLGEKCWPVVS